MSEHYSYIFLKTKKFKKAKRFVWEHSAIGYKLLKFDFTLNKHTNQMVVIVVMEMSIKKEMPFTEYIDIDPHMPQRFN